MILTLSVLDDFAMPVVAASVVYSKYVLSGCSVRNATDVQLVYLFTVHLNKLMLLKSVIHCIVGNIGNSH